MEPSGIIGINMKKQNIEIKIGDIVEVECKYYKEVYII